MEILSLPRGTSYPPIPKTALALGLFDGVHLGHLELLQKTLDQAKRLGLAPGVVTFCDEAGGVKPHTPKLQSQEERLATFEAMGFAYVFLLSFPGVKNLTPDAFVKDILLETCNAHLAVCGYNFRFGMGATGDPATLTDLLRSAGADALVLPPYLDGEGSPVSSSSVRQALSLGQVERAAALLGRPFSFTLPVSHGRALGRTLGFPTANQVLPPDFPPLKLGVYSTTACVNGTEYPALTNIGVRPTFGGEGVWCESYLLGFSGDLYDTPLTLTLRHFIRPERQFPSAEALTEQIEKDLLEVKKEHGIH